MSHQFYRLVWKEYRAQRTLWFALVIASIAIAGTAMMLSDRSVDFMALSGIALVITVAFGVASVAVAFSGEEEDGTAMWLRMFPLRPGMLLAGKLTACVTGMLGLLLVTTCGNVLLSLSLGRDGLSGIISEVGSLKIQDPLRATAAVCGFVVLALASSLRCRKVFRALAWSGLWFLVFAITSANSEWGGGSPVPLAITLVAAASVYPLASRWWRGRGRGEVADDSVGLLRLPFQVVPRRRLSAFYRRTLVRAATASSLLQRTTRVLLWREVRFALPFAAGCLGVGTCLLALAALMPQTQTPFLMLFIVPVIVECGLRTFRHDQQQLNGLFWSHRGVSPALVWLIRLGVWFTTLLMILAVLAILEQVVLSQFLSHMEARRQDSFVTAIVGRAWQQIGWRAIDVLACLVIGGFVICQLMSCWVRKPVVAAFCGILGVILFGMWVGWLASRDIPMWLTVWPIVAVCLVAGFVSRRSWMDRRWTLRAALQPVALIAVPCLCMWPLQQWWRVFQIPTPTTSQSTTLAVSGGLRPGLSDQYDYFGYSDQNQNSPEAAAWNQLTVAAASAFATSDTPSLTRVYLPDEEQLDEALAALDVILAADLNETRLPPQWRVPWARYSLPVGATNVLLGHAEQQFQAGHPAEAVTEVIQAVRLNQYLMQEATSWKQWRDAATYQRFALQVLQRMIADDRLADAELVQAEEQLGDASRFLHEHFNVINNRCLVYQQLLWRTGYLWEEYERLTKVQASRWPQVLINSSRAERIRTWKLMWLIANMDQHTIADDRTIYSAQLDRWLSTSVYFETDLFQSLAMTGGLNSPTERLFKSLLNEQRATAVMIGLQRYRRKHGTFPASLFDLHEFGFAADDRRLREHGEQVLFGYAASGIGSPVPVMDDFGSMWGISAGQPILWSAGQLSPLHINTVIKPERHAVSEVDPGRVWFINGTTISGLGEDTAFWMRNLHEIKKVAAEQAESNTGSDEAEETESPGELKP